MREKHPEYNRIRTNSINKYKLVNSYLKIRNYISNIYHSVLFANLSIKRAILSVFMSIGIRSVYHNACIPLPFKTFHSTSIHSVYSLIKCDWLCIGSSQKLYSACLSTRLLAQLLLISILSIILR